MDIVNDITVSLDTTPQQLRALALAKAGYRAHEARTFVVLRRSVDARRKRVQLVYTVGLSKTVEEVPCYTPTPRLPLPMRPVVVGFGPAGMLCAYALAQAGLRPIVLERGFDVDTRTAMVRDFWQNGQLKPQCNVQFGEGGAGAFSDGKLTTGTGDKFLQRYVLQTFVRYGASPDILYDAKPHVGTDRLVDVVRGIRRQIIEWGGEVRFGETVRDIVPMSGGVQLVTDLGSYTTAHAVLAIGHSARDTYRMLYRRGYSMQPKPFAVGVRIEHLQSDITAALYGDSAGHPALGPADYRLVAHTPYGGVYSFCMCPGGYVVASSSQPDTVVTNGMSYASRAGVNANAALLVGVTPQDFGEGVFDGMDLQGKMEKQAFALGGGGYYAPCQLLGDFVAGRNSTAFGRVQPTYRPGVAFARLDNALPYRVADAMRVAVEVFGRKIEGYDAPDSVLTGFETRSSAPLRVQRTEAFLAVDNPYVYPCGEGCGYAGGIMSAATDGLKVAQRIMDAAPSA